MGAARLKELPKCATFIRVTQKVNKIYAGHQYMDVYYKKHPENVPDEFKKFNLGDIGIFSLFNIEEQSRYNLNVIIKFGEFGLVDLQGIGCGAKWFVKKR